jgi:myo-inositol-1(or 4)-monophosphatase
MNETTQFTTSLARRTGELLEGLFQTRGTDYRLKADDSIVTEADLAADRLIAQTILKNFPGEIILSEELQPVLPQINRQAIWVVDLLDGTTNFSLGLPIWGIAIARLVNGIPVSAALYYPMLGELYEAESARGAFLNGEPIQALPPIKDRPAAYFACCGRTHKQYQVHVPYKPRILGSATYDLCAVARGAAILAFEATPHIWDLAAPWLLVRESGGVIEAHHGSQPFPITSGTNYSGLTFPTIAAATSTMVAKGREMIQLRSLDVKSTTPIARTT